jgi:hypothetical protein
MFIWKPICMKTCASTFIIILFNNCQETEVKRERKKWSSYKKMCLKTMQLSVINQSENYILCDSNYIMDRMEKYII